MNIEIEDDVINNKVQEVVNKFIRSHLFSSVVEDELSTITRNKILLLFRKSSIKEIESRIKNYIVEFKEKAIENIVNEQIDTTIKKRLREEYVQGVIKAHITGIEQRLNDSEALKDSVSSYVKSSMDYFISTEFKDKLSKVVHGMVCDSITDLKKKNLI